MIKPLENKFLHYIIRTYIHYILRKDFQKIVFEAPFLDASKSVLLLGNHFSWWDGFIPFYLNNIHYHRKFYILMLEEKLRQFPLFRYTGAYSIRPGTRSAIESLRYTAQLLKNSENLVVFFPQGKIQSLYQENPAFEKGISKILEATDSHYVQVVLASTLPDYLDKRRPTLYVRWKLYNDLHEFSTLKASFKEHLLASKQLQSAYEV